MDNNISPLTFLALQFQVGLVLASVLAAMEGAANRNR